MSPYLSEQDQSKVIDVISQKLKKFMSKINIQSLFKDSILLKNQCIEQGFDSLITIGDAVVSSIMDGGKLLLCGNGGSAADAQHLAAELFNRLRPNYNRVGLPG